MIDEWSHIEAQFVAKHGPDFEAKIATKEASNAKFAFLQPGHPYHSYYRHKIAEFQGTAPAAATAQVGAAPAAGDATTGAAAADKPSGAAKDAHGTLTVTVTVMMMEMMNQKRMERIWLLA